jgi:hypothetical protein
MLLQALKRCGGFDAYILLRPACPEPKHGKKTASTRFVQFLDSMDKAEALRGFLPDRKITGRASSSSWLSWLACKLRYDRNALNCAAVQVVFLTRKTTRRSFFIEDSHHE